MSMGRPVPSSARALEGYGPDREDEPDRDDERTKIRRDTEPEHGVRSVWHLVVGHFSRLVRPPGDRRI